MAAIFELDQIKDLPFWAQALIASRMVRRAVHWLPVNVEAAAREPMLAACDVLDACAFAGARTKGEVEVIARARAQTATPLTHAVVQALEWAADAGHAADDTQNFGAADAACINSTQQALAHAARSPGLSPLQVNIFAAADLDQLRFACKEAGVGRYDGLGKEVRERLAPVYPPNEPTPAMTRPPRAHDDEDPTRGAR